MEMFLVPFFQQLPHIQEQTSVVVFDFQAVPHSQLQYSLAECQQQGYQDYILVAHNFIVADYNSDDDFDDYYIFYYSHIVYYFVAYVVDIDYYYHIDVYYKYQFVDILLDSIVVVDNIVVVKIVAVAVTIIIVEIVGVVGQIVGKYHRFDKIRLLMDQYKFIGVDNLDYIVVQFLYNVNRLLQLFYRFIVIFQEVYGYLLLY